jgi:hypothetical protein
MVVAIAVPGGFADRFAASAGAAFSAIGAPRELVPGGGTNVVIAGIHGDGRSPLARSSRSAVDLAIASGAEFRRTAVAIAAPIQLQSTAGEAAIRQGSRDVVRTTEGVAVAVWNADGRLAHAFVLEAARDFRVPIAAGPLSVYPARSPRPRDDLPVGGWTDVLTSLRTGSAIVRVEPGASAVLYASDDGPPLPRIIDRSSDGVRIDVTPFESAASAALHARMAADQMNGAPLDWDANVYRIEVNAPAEAPASVLLAFGGIPRLTMGRVMGSEASHASILSVDTNGLLRTPDARSEVLLMARDEQAQLTGPGWSPVDWDSVSPYRWLTAAEARLVLPVAGSHPRRIRIQAVFDGTRAPASVRLRLNRTELPAQRLRPGWHAYEWPVPAGALASGINEAAGVVDGLPASQSAGGVVRAVAVNELRVIHTEP